MGPVVVEEGVENLHPRSTGPSISCASLDRRWTDSCTPDPEEPPLVDVPVAVIHSEPEQCPPASVTSNGCVGLLRLRLFIDIFSYCAAALDFPVDGLLGVRRSLYQDVFRHREAVTTLQKGGPCHGKGLLLRIRRAQLLVSCRRDFPNWSNRSFRRCSSRCRYRRGFPHRHLHHCWIQQLRCQLFAARKPAYRTRAR